MTIDYAQRGAWQDHRTDIGLRERALHPVLHPAFSLMAEPACVVVLLPQDPLAPLLDFDAETSSMIPQRFEGFASRMRDSVLNEVLSSGSHMLRVTRDPAGPLRSLAGVARHGGAVAAVGSAAAYDHRGTRVLRLSSLTSTVRLALATQIEVHRLPAAKHLAGGPFEVTVALPGAAGSLLDGYAPGWTGLQDGLDSPPVCEDENAMIRLEIAAVPTERDDIGRVLTQIMGRVGNLFGTDEPLYAPRMNINAGVARDY